MPLPDNPEKDSIIEDLKIALQETLLLAGKEGIPLFLTGGTAAALYSAEAVRPLSFDLDFMIYQGDPGVMQKITTTFGVQFRRFQEKPLFKSQKAVGKSQNGCDLDFILDQQIVPEEETPGLHIRASLNDAALHCQQKQLNGVDVWVVPPEYVVLTKLFAGRGQERGKYDLTDAAAVLKNRAKNNFNPMVFGQLLKNFCAPETTPAVKAQIAQRLLDKIELLKTTKKYGITTMEDREFLQILQTSITQLQL